MASFEEDQIKIAEIRANMLKGGSKAEADKKIQEYFDNKVKAVRAKLHGTDQANKASENEEIKTYYDVTVTNTRKKEVG